jgi:hypothetical protein
VTVVLVDGRYTITVDTESPRPLPYAWDREGKPIYEYVRRADRDAAVVPPSSEECP